MCALPHANARTHARAHMHRHLHTCTRMRGRACVHTSPRHDSLAPVPPPTSSSDAHQCCRPPQPARPCPRAGALRPTSTQSAGRSCRGAARALATWRGTALTGKRLVCTPAWLRLLQSPPSPVAVATAQAAMQPLAGCAAACAAVVSCLRAARWPLQMQSRLRPQGALQVAGCPQAAALQPLTLRRLPASRSDVCSSRLQVDVRIGGVQPRVEQRAVEGGHPRHPQRGHLHRGDDVQAGVPRWAD
jgi:hypothetical protein